MVQLFPQLELQQNKEESMASTQDHLSISDTREDLAILKDGSMALILQTTAVNFDLLSEREQLAIIGSFAATLNSLSFAIQLLIRSKRLDITSYLALLADAQKKQTNPLLHQMMLRYRSFIERTVQENDVLDKQFYIIIPVSALELGISKDIEGHLPKAQTILIPRRDHMIKQLANLGLRVFQLNNEQIVRLFYDFYNPPKEIPIEEWEKKQAAKDTPVAEPQQTIVTTQQPKLPESTNAISIPQPQTVPASPQIKQPTQAIYKPVQKSNPTHFVVEELEDDYTNLTT